MALESVYNPKDFENKIYSEWQTNQIGKPEVHIVTQNTTHSILMPPPNLTGALHAGHAFQHYLADTLSRYARLNGQKSLWFPGVDHAGLQLEGVIDKLFIIGEFDKKIENVVKDYSNESLQRISQILKTKDRKNLAHTIKQNLPELWLECAWEKVNLWRNNQMNQSTILGDTPDYSRQLFTLDPKPSNMVIHAFQEYWKDGLLFKDKYLINWSVGLQTALSDVSGDIDYVTRKDPFINFLYKYESIKANSKLTYDVNLIESFLKDFPIIVGTVRPETIHGDMAIAIHPEILDKILNKSTLDKSIAKQFVQDLSARDIEITYGIPELGVNNVFMILSEKVDKNFGSGVLKITPSSDMTDFDIWINDYNGGQFKSAINKQGLLNDICGIYKGLTREEGRLKIIYDLCKNGYVDLKEGKSKEDLKEFTYLDYDKSVLELKEILQDYTIDFDYEHNVTICERSKTIVEPLISDEMFISMHKKSISTGLSLQEHGLEGLSETNCYSYEYQSRGINFCNSLKDWCVSRNLLWGHQIPVWYNLGSNPDRTFYNYNDWETSEEVKDKFFIGSFEQLKKFLEGRNEHTNSWVQEEKRLDTWFSSSLWPLSSFGYLEYINGDNEGDFATYYPTTTMATAKEIFNIWICRMIMLSKYFTSKLTPVDRLYNKVPFTDLVIHPTILDDKGKKMSKSLGNGMEPEKQIEKYSSDALRMAMLSGMIPDRNMRFGGRLADELCEKYRNFGNKIWNIIKFLQSKDAFKTHLTNDFDPTLSGWWLLSKYNECLKQYDEGFKNYQLTSSLEALYDFVWNELAPWHLEFLKVNPIDLPLTTHIVKDLIQILSPFMPFEAEVLWKEITGESMALTLRRTHDVDHWIDQMAYRGKLVKGFEDIVESIEGLRSIKGLFSIPAGKDVEYYTTLDYVVENQEYVKMMTKCTLANLSQQDWYQVTRFLEADVLVHIEDKSAEIERTDKKIVDIKKQKNILEQTLANQDFVKNASGDAIKQKYQDLEARNSDLEVLELKLVILKR
jgi:valyl-tRNA synthetase